MTNIEGRLASIEGSLKAFLEVEPNVKVVGVHRLSLKGWRSWAVEDKCMALFYLLPILIVLVLTQPCRLERRTSSECRRHRDHLPTRHTGNQGTEIWPTLKSLATRCSTR